MRKYFYLLGLVTMMLGACVSSNRHIVGQDSPLTGASKRIAAQIQTKIDITDRMIQISPNNFWERKTNINMPFSTVLSDTISSELSRMGAVITVQETGKEPLKVVGTYQTAGGDVIITVMLRQMGKASSRDFAVVQERISLKDMDKNWLKPQFGRMARTMVRLLEDDYSSWNAVRVNTEPFRPGTVSQPELMLGPEFEKYIRDALASSPIFMTAAGPGPDIGAVLTGDYRVMNSKMVFHAAVVSTDGRKVLAGASFESATADIPSALMHPKNASLDDLAGNAADSIIRQYRKDFNSIGKKTRVIIDENSFHDLNQNAVIPLSRQMAGKLKTRFTNDSMFTVINQSFKVADLVLSGSFFRDDSFLFVTVNLDQAVLGKTGVRTKNLARVEEKIDQTLCPEHWFDQDLRGKTAFLMHKLEKKSLSGLSAGRNNEIVINRFKYENSRAYSKFSDYLDGHILDYFTSSRYFSPVTNLEQRLAAFKQGEKPPVILANKTTATLAMLTRADYYVDGTFWPSKNGQVEIKAVLSEAGGRILASEHIRFPKNLMDPSWFQKTGSQNHAEDLNAVSAGETGLSLELLTQKGRNNLSFKAGEEMIFFLKAGKAVYVNMFTADTDNRIFMIYPNRFTTAHPKLRAGEVTLIPDNSYNSDFKFEVQGKTGHEMVFAFASDKPLPRLPATRDTGIFGLKLVGRDVKDIKNYFSRHARQNGASLSWDSLSIRTVQ